MKIFSYDAGPAFVNTYWQSHVSLRDVTLSARRLLAFILMLVIFMVAARPIGDPDFWWHLRTGQYIWETRTIPHADIFSTVFYGREWVAHEWLSETLMYGLYRVGGYVGLVVFFALLITAAMWIVYRRCAERAGHVYVVGFALVLGALAASPTWGVRPQMFSFLFASIFVAVLDDYARGKHGNFVWWLVPLTVLWVNMHAGFALGLALIGLALAGMLLNVWLTPAEEGDGQPRASVWPRVRQLALVFGACVAAVPLNPNGLRLYSYPFETLTSRAMMKFIEEWFSPDFHELMFLPLAALIFATFTALAVSKERARPGELLLLTALGFAALRSGRNAPFFALVAMPLLAGHGWNWLAAQSWGRWLAEPEKRETGRQATLKVALNVVLLIVIPLAICFVKVGKVVANRAGDEAKNFPVAAADFMRTQKPPSPIYNEYGWGGYLIWNFYPDYRVYIDGRADVYGDAFMEEFMATHDGATKWREPLERYGVRTVIVAPNAPLASLLRQEDGWRKAFEDAQAVIFIRE
ncbi:MAG: hypothetical protein LC754_16425 [Acidobacteria bacterium]|nr:hypothetical protein [Acidobacteriota bacterium]